MHRTFVASLCFLAGLFAIQLAADEPLWVAKPFTPGGGVHRGIEGPNCDAAGNVFAVNYAREGTIGRVTPQGEAEVFVELPQVSGGKQSVGNGIVFDPAGTMYVADYVNHNVLAIEPASRRIRVFVHDDRFHQPNDLAMAPDGMIYCSDPDWEAGSGQLFRVDTAGKITRLAENLGIQHLFEAPIANYQNALRVADKNSAEHDKSPPIGCK